MKVLSRVMLIIGAVVLVGAIGVLFYGGLEVWKQFIALSANRSRDFINPLNTMLGGAGLALVAGFLLGLGLGIPRRRGTVDGAPVQPAGRPASNPQASSDPQAGTTTTPAPGGDLR